MNILFRTLALIVYRATTCYEYFPWSSVATLECFFANAMLEHFKHQQQNSALFILSLYFMNTCDKGSGLMISLNGTCFFNLVKTSQYIVYFIAYARILINANNYTFSFVSISDFFFSKKDHDKYTRSSWKNFALLFTLLISLPVTRGSSFPYLLKTGNFWSLSYRETYRIPWKCLRL